LKDGRKADTGRNGRCDESCPYIHVWCTSAVVALYSVPVLDRQTLKAGSAAGRVRRVGVSRARLTTNWPRSLSYITYAHSHSHCPPGMSLSDTWLGLHRVERRSHHHKDGRRYSTSS